MGLLSADLDIGKKLFALAKRGIPSVNAIFEQSVLDVLGQNASDVTYIKNNFSGLIAGLQERAYQLYLDSEKQACGKAVVDHLVAELGQEPAAGVIFDFLHANFGGIDKFCLSLTQSRRPRAGKTFELSVSSLFEKLEYPYAEQIEVDGSKPDYVLPSGDWYAKYAGDCLIFTCKRTLRERWRQVVTEGISGQSFYLGTIDDKLSAAELARMQDRRVIVVVPVELKVAKYSAALNVISFEAFFEHHLDTAMARWRANGAI
jgi:restriction endonuclease EcoRII-like protein